MEEGCVHDGLDDGERTMLLSRKLCRPGRAPHHSQRNLAAWGHRRLSMPHWRSIPQTAERVIHTRSTHEAAAVDENVSGLHFALARSLIRAQGARLARPTRPVLRFVTHNAALIMGRNSGIATWTSRFGEQTRDLVPRLDTQGLYLRRKS